VIAFDHRGHGRSSVPPRGRYTLDLLAADVDAVLDATVAPGERAVLAGHSMGGIAIGAWSHRFRDKVDQRADGVAMINTTTGDIIRQVKFLTMRGPLSVGRNAVGSRIVRRFGGIPTVSAAAGPSKRFVAAIAVGRGADPEVADFVYDLFHHTPRRRGGSAAMLMDALDRRHLNLDG
jgi:pimeloyl-ACP methyl ester carboxylesterase